MNQKLYFYFLRMKNQILWLGNRVSVTFLVEEMSKYAIPWTMNIGTMRISKEKKKINIIFLVYNSDSSLILFEIKRIKNKE